MLQEGTHKLLFAFDTDGSVTESVYDKVAQQLQAIDAKNKPKSSVCNARGQRVSEIDRWGFATHWAYDAGRNLLSLTDAEAQTTKYTYNDAGHTLLNSTRTALPVPVTGLFDVEFLAELSV